MEHNKNSLVEVLLVLLKWKWHIATTCVIAGVGSALIALFVLPVYFKSTCIFYPYSPKLADARTLYMKDVNYDIFGRSSDIDRLISISNSSVIIKDMIKEFDLVKHYKIDSTQHTNYDAIKEFRDNLEVIKNDEGAIELTIFDQNDTLCAEMVKIMVGKINYINLQTTLQNNEKTLEVYKNHVGNKTTQLKSITDSLQKLKTTYLILDPGEESKLLAQQLVKLKAQLAEAKASNQNGKVANLNRRIDALELTKFNEASDIVKGLDKQLITVTDELNEATESYLQTKSAIDNQLQTLFIVEEAIRAEKKVKPVRSVIVLSTVLVTFLVMSLLVLIINFYQTEVRHLVN